ncbi:sodium stibogluconate resistance protein, putative [Leishmania tarentolae]|uniref:Sodium stibogluconate resistance protein, putative n=1 Tax=Leishmania tarentolae TaxID=5689 RepID=A0A640KW37_LEITA|nr:sodium stibogluconate resistance protein, putative [Leishmania tarentolae]
MPALPQHSCDGGLPCCPLSVANALHASLQLLPPALPHVSRCAPSPLAFYLRAAQRAASVCLSSSALLPQAPLALSLLSAAAPPPSPFPHTRTQTHTHSRLHSCRVPSPATPLCDLVSAPARACGAARRAHAGMGNSQSSVPVEGEGHPEVFYRGVTAARDGRYTVSEVYFVQALTRHPGRSFWETLTSAVLLKERRAGLEGGGASLPKDGVQDEADAGASVDAPSGGRSDAPPKTVLGGGVTDNAPALATGENTQLGGGRDELAGSGDRGDGGGSAEQTNAAGNGAQSVYDTKVVDVFLPLDENLTDIMDYYRLIADIGHTYLQLIPSTENVEKVTGLAARYCVFTITHTQILLHCLKLWKEAKIDDGGGFIDYAKVRSLKIGSGVTKRTDSLNADSHNSKQRKHNWRTIDRTASLLFTLQLLEANCRYYCLVFLVNYCALLLRSSSRLKDQRKVDHVHANILEHVHMVRRMVVDLAEEYPNEYLSRLVMASLPKPSNADRECLSSVGASSHMSSQKVLSFGNDQHRHLYAAGYPWSPTQSALVPLMLARNGRLTVQENVGRHSQVQIRSPAERMSYHYTRWHFDSGLVILPGCSLYLLKRSIPGFVPGKSTFAHYATMAEHEEFRLPGGEGEADLRGGSVSVRVPGDGGGGAPHTPRIPGQRRALLMLRSETLR